jgi:hypothetical protein
MFFISQIHMICLNADRYHRCMCSQRCVQVSKVAKVNERGIKMVVCVNAQSSYLHDWGSWREWRANPHNDGFPPIKLHAPRLTHGSLGSSSLST